MGQIGRERHFEGCRAPYYKMGCEEGPRPPRFAQEIPSVATSTCSSNSWNELQLKPLQEPRCLRTTGNP